MGVRAPTTGPGEAREPPHAQQGQRAIIGVGNVLLSDEGVGVHAVRLLARRATPKRIAILDGGTEGLGLMDAIVGLDRLVVIDCVRAGHVPGTLFVFDWDDGSPHTGRAMSSAHQVSVADLLGHVALLGRGPRTTIIGVEPESLEIGTSLSATVAAQLERVCAMALRAAEDS
jgi:hydrogenase maturation protease